MRLEYLKAIARKIYFLLAARFLLICARCLNDRKSLVRLEHLCKKVLTRNPRNYLANYYLAQSFRKQGKLDEAIEVHKRLPQLPSSRFLMDTIDLLWILHEGQRYDEVIQLSQEAFRKLQGPLHVLDKPLSDVFLDSIHRVVGGSYAALDDYEKAIPHLEIACKMDKTSETDKIRELLQQCRENRGNREIGDSH